MPKLAGKTRVYLTIYGVEPSEVTRRLRIAPQSTCVAGTALRSGLLARHWWEVSESSDEDLRVVMARLLDRLRPSWDELAVLAGLAEEIEMEVAIYRDDDEREESMTLVLEPDVMAALGVLRPHVQFSIY